MPLWSFNDNFLKRTTVPFQSETLYQVGGQQIVLKRKIDHAKKMSTANPQQNEYIWPEVKLVEWTSFSGKSLKGLLLAQCLMDQFRRKRMKRWQLP